MRTFGEPLGESCISCRKKGRSGRAKVQTVWHELLMDRRILYEYYYREIAYCLTIDEAQHRSDEYGKAAGGPNDKEMTLVKSV